MHPRIEELTDYIDAQRAGLVAALAAVPDSLRDRRPGPDTWSVAEVLEHLHIVEAGIARLIGRKIEKARAAGLRAETESGSLLGSLDRFALLDRSSSLPAPELVQPRGSMTAAEAATALVQSRGALRHALAAGDGLALGTLSAPHPLLGPLTLYEWVLFVGQHECRHTRQIGDIERLISSNPES